MAVRLVPCRWCKREFDMNTLWCNVGAEPWYECKEKCCVPAPEIEIRPALGPGVPFSFRRDDPSFLDRIQEGISRLFHRGIVYKLIKQD